MTAAARQRLYPLERRTVVAAALAIVAVMLGWSMSVDRGSPPTWSTIRLATATVGGTYYRLGEEFAAARKELGRDGELEVLATPGSIENIRMVLEEEAELAFVAGPALVADAGAEHLRVLAYLYDDMLQLVVPEGSDVKRIADLEGRRVYVGTADSATQLIADRVLKDMALTRFEDLSYAAAAERLARGKLDAAFFCAGTPTEAVERALAGRCRIVDLSDDRRDILERLAPLGRVTEAELPAFSYPSQSSAIETVQTPVYLVCHKKLPAAKAESIVEGMFEILDEVLLRHTTRKQRTAAEKIRLQGAFPDLPDGLRYHRGAPDFRAAEERKLIIATGPSRGMYNFVGQQIADLLNQEGIKTRVLTTDGSVENVRMLMDGQHAVLAILQYDVALAAFRGNAAAVYKTTSVQLTNVHLADIRRIVTLHEEQVFIVARREDWPEDTPRTVADLANKAVGVGAMDSGTYLVATAILDCHEVEVTQHALPVDVMLRQLKSGKLDAAFFVSGTPSESLGELLDDPDYCLLSVDSSEIGVLTASGAVKRSTIAAGRFKCQRLGELGVQGIATQAVLVTVGDLPRDVGTITRAIFGGAGFLGIGETPEQRLQTHLASIKLHPDARKVYQELGYRPTTPGMSALELAAHILAILVIVVGTARGVRLLWREWISNRIKERVFDVARDLDQRDAVRRLLPIRQHVQALARLRWWHPHNLDRARWHDLEEMIDQRIREARSRHMKSMLASVRQSDLDDETKQNLRHEAWTLVEAGELAADQLELVLRALDDRCAPRSDGRSRTG